MPAPDSSETRQLLERIHHGDRQAFDSLFARHRETVRRAVACRMDQQLRSRVDPSDVVQETQLEAYRRMEDYLVRQPMPFRLWLHKTALQRLAKVREHHAAAAKRSIEREIDLPDQTSDQLVQCIRSGNSTPSQLVAKRELRQRVRQAMLELSDSDREILLMRYIEKLNNQEIGYILELDPAAVSKRHGRALLRLERELRRDGIGESEL